MLKPIKKAFTILRDNGIIYALNKVGFPITAKVYNWITTETTDVAIFMLAGKIGFTTIQSKYVLLLILSFLL